MEGINEAVEYLVKLGRLTAGPQIAPGGNVPYVINADGNVKALPELVFNEHSETPERVRASVTVLDPESFVSYYRLFADKSSRVFADESKHAVTGVIDYHESAKSPRWGHHRVTLALRQSEEWKIWNGCNNKQMSQQAFSEFLEQNSTDITVPTPAAIMEVARDLEATTEVEFGSGLRMADGQVRFRYTETVKATTSGGQVAVPERFGLGIPIFVGGALVPISALLRFRAKEGKLTFWYTLLQPEKAIRLAFLAARDEIATALEITIINGAA